jgi:type IV pilus assembly protein PilZ
MNVAATAEKPQLVDGTGAAAARRPSVISLSIREKAALQAAYMPFVANGGLFVPTLRPAHLGDDLYLILTLMDDSTRFAIPGKVAWITPAGSTGRQQGLGIQFDGSEAGTQARAKIEMLVGGQSSSGRATNTL